MALRRQPLIAIILISVALVIVPLVLYMAQRITGGYGLQSQAQSIDFRWQAVDGDWHDFSDWHDGPTYLFMGFLSCSDICPLRIGQLMQLDTWLAEQEGAYDKSVRFLFITIDPDTDTPSIREQLIDQRSTRFVSARMQQADLDKLQSILREKITTQSGLLNHVGNLYLVSENGTLARIYTQWQLSTQKMLADLTPLLK
ncbi:SCO family protein [Shewanella algidipiscicola]|nr:SCO family protein [Shewanella algidipiscicola]